MYCLDNIHDEEYIYSEFCRGVRIKNIAKIIKTDLKIPLSTAFGIVQAVIIKQDKIRKVS